MKNVTTLKSNNINSPKTPGGISKSLLTPCRRLGLSRNWRNNGPSPFISPLASATPDVKEEKTETRKRKQRVAEENVEEGLETSTVDENEINSENIDTTPSRNVAVPRKKKSKTLLSAINKAREDIISVAQEKNGNCTEAETTEQPLHEVSHNNEHLDVVSTPVRTKSKKSKKRSPLKPSPIISTKDAENMPVACMETIPTIPTVEQSPKEETIYKIKETSPNDLKKECVVVIQRKIFKKVPENKCDQFTKNTTESKTSTIEIDSDSDDTPLINLPKQNSTISITKEIVDDDDDFAVSKSSKVIPTKEKQRSPKNKHKSKLTKPKVQKVITEQNLLSQNSFDEDDDDDFDNKRTILIKKSYDKVSKPLKAKSTGSITQRDIDNLRERIEAKKKLLLAQAITPDTEELRSLIKKWQKGCQDALMELLDLMKTKFHDKERMDYSEMLKALKIPPALVGYDSENDCFISPNDASVILGQFKDV